MLMKNKLQFSKGLLMLFLVLSFQTSMARANEPKNEVQLLNLGINLLWISD